jgi:UDPglucose 6-dehydrogenase
MRNSVISVIGLGKLGMPLAACLASKGFEVIGADSDPQKVQAVNEGRTPVFEPELPELIEKHKQRLSATEDIGSAVLASEVSFIVVPTPSDPNGGFSLRFVLPACEMVGRALRSKETFHLVVLTSTVMPGSTGKEIRQSLETHSGKQCGVDFGLCYNPEFVALGSVITNMLNPDFILIGESDDRSGDSLANLYHKLCVHNPPIARMDFINAELTKLAVNAFVTTKISYANMLAQVCENLPGADVDVVTSALGFDSRIGRKYLKGAIGYGGPCFPRDNLAFAQLARQIGAGATLAEATDDFNRRQVVRLGEIVMSRLHDGGKVGILGVSYKPNTNVVDESQGLELARYLLSRGVPVTVYDPAGMDNARLVLGPGAVFATSAPECTRESDVVVITTPWEEFRSLSPRDLNHTNGGPTIVDCWRILPRDQFEPCAEYIAVGIGPVLGSARVLSTKAA